jgi:hypothetical protein
MSLLTHAKIELDAIGMTEDSDDEMNVMMRKHILHMVNEFAEEGHSGFSASYAAGLLDKLFRYQPLCPLSGDDSEWVDVGQQSGYPLYQNKRCGRVFKEGDGQAYDMEGKVFYDIYTELDGEPCEPYKSYFTNRESRVTINFPYTPNTEYVERK